MQQLEIYYTEGFKILYQQIRSKKPVNLHKKDEIYVICLSASYEGFTQHDNLFHIVYRSSLQVFSAQF